MPCYKPLQGWYAHTPNPETGKRSIVFKRSDGHYDRPITVPCGQCHGCRIDRSRMWALRCVHEASLYDNNCFLTLTYSDDNIPSNGSLVKKHFQDFMKRLRKEFGEGIRYFHCGEYGEKFSRPHYHACLFNFDFPDKVLWDIVNGCRLYRSPILQRLWPLGYSTVGDVTFESAAYVARYCLKKITGEAAPDHYQGRASEYVTMSRRPGLGHAWLKKFTSDVYPQDFIQVNDHIKVKPPKYYDSIFDLTSPDLLCKLKSDRKARAAVNPDNRLDRLAVRGKVKLAKIETLRRCLH